MRSPTSRAARFFLAAIIVTLGWSAHGDEMVFPGEQWVQAAPESQGIDSEQLTRAVEFLKGQAGRDGVRELVIVRNGRMIWQGDNVDKVHGVWSCTKSFTSTVLGFLIEDGKCSLDTRAAEYVLELATVYSEITLRHFATMTSGYQAVGDDAEVSHGQSPTPFDPSPEPLFSPPGSQFAYWDSAMNMFALVLTRIAGEPLEDLFERRIAGPIGMHVDHWSWGEFKTEGGIPVNGGAGNKGKFIAISAREMARFGHLFLNEGRWNGRPLISRDWVQQATTVQATGALSVANPQNGLDRAGSYGFNWHVNGKNRDGHLRWPGAPTGTFAAMGFNNNVCLIVPEWNLVVVRLGLDQKDGRISDETWSEFLNRVGQSLLPGDPTRRLPAKGDSCQSAAWRRFQSIACGDASRPLSSVVGGEVYSRQRRWCVPVRNAAVSS